MPGEQIAECEALRYRLYKDGRLVMACTDYRPCFDASERYGARRWEIRKDGKFLYASIDHSHGADHG